MYLPRAVAETDLDALDRLAHRPRVVLVGEQHDRPRLVTADQDHLFHHIAVR